MNRELGTFLTVVDELLQDKSIEMEAVQMMDAEQIRIFGKEAYREFVDEQVRLHTLLTNFAMVCTILIHRGTPVIDALATMASKSDRSGDSYVKAITKACCEDILERYISLEGKMD